VVVPVTIVTEYRATRTVLVGPTASSQEKGEATLRLHGAMQAYLAHPG
jgi:hypothetical protein